MVNPDVNFSECCVEINFADEYANVLVYQAHHVNAMEELEERETEETWVHEVFVDHVVDGVS